METKVRKAPGALEGPGMAAMTIEREEEEEEEAMAARRKRTSKTRHQPPQSPGGDAREDQRLRGVHRP